MPVLTLEAPPDAALQHHQKRRRRPQAHVVRTGPIVVLIIRNATVPNLRGGAPQRNSSSTFTSTFISSGTAADGGWQRWWATESRRVGSDWPGILAAHAAVFQQLCQNRGLSS
jgi:hypothetical protein